MMTDAGLAPGQRWSKPIRIEYPDADLAARAFASNGPAFLAIQRMGEAAFLEAARQAAEELTVPDAGVRYDFEIQFLVGDKPT